MTRKSTILLLAAIASVTLSLPAFAQTDATTVTPADAPASAPATTAVDLNPSRIVADQVATLSRTMLDATLSQDARDAAARRLLGIGTPEARTAIQTALRDPGNNAGRLAAVRAVADDLPGDLTFVDPLFVLLSGDVPKPTVDAAVVALGNFKLEPDVSRRLVEMTQAGRPEPQRIAAIHALAGQVEKRAAAQLVALTQDPSPAVATAANEAIRQFASAPIASPAEWWRARADRSDDRFRLETLAARTTRSEGEVRRGEETYQELRRSVLATITAASRDARADVLIRFLTSPREAVRQIAVTQAYDYTTTGDLPAAARPAVRELLSDPDPDVRLMAARTVFNLNDAEAVSGVARQLVVETDPRVRVELAQTMGLIGNASAVPILRSLLDDTSTPVVAAAATALARLGPEVAAQNPTDAADLAIKLQAVLQSRNASGDQSPEARRLREALVAALVPLRQPSMLAMYTSMLSATPRESEAIRRLAVAGLGAIGRPDTASLLVEALRDEAVAVRIEAAKALGAVGTAGKTFVNAEAIYRAMEPSRESEPKVAIAEWAAIKQLLPFAPRAQLAGWPTLPFIRDNDSRLLDVYIALEQKAGEAQAWDEQTYYLQQVADTQMRLGEAAERGLDVPAARQRYNDATATYQRALDLTRQKGGPSMRVQTLIVNTVKSLLRARDYAGAAKFASAEFRGPGGDELKGTIGPEFKLEAEDLASKNQFDDAQNLIREALAMTPALAAQHRSHLLEVQQNIERRQREKNEYAIPEFLQSLAMR